MEILREDKKVSCLNCYHSFWVDAKTLKKFIWCPRCGSAMIEYIKENGKIVKEERKYYY